MHVQGRHLKLAAVIPLLCILEAICSVSCIVRIDPSSDIPVRIPVIGHSMLGNGVSVYILANNNTELVTVRCAFRAGDSSTPEQKSGSLLLLYHYLLYSQIFILQQFDQIGAHPSIQFSQENSAIEVVTESENLALATELMSKLIRKPQFSRDRFGAVKNRLIRELELRAVTAMSLGDSAIRAAIYGNEHPLARSGRQLVQKIRGLSLEDIIHDYNEFVGPRNIAVIIAGCTSQVAVNALVNKYMGDWASDAEETPAIPAPAPRRRKAVLLVPRPGQTFSHIVLGGLGLPMGHSDESALAMAAQLIGESIGGRIERLGIARLRMRSTIARFGATGHYSWSIDVPTEKTWLVVAEALGAVTETQTYQIPISRFPSLRAFQVSETAGVFLDRSRTLSSVSELYWNHQPSQYHINKFGAAKYIGLNDVERVLVKYFSPSYLHIAIVADLAAIRDKIPNNLQPSAIHNP